uniref:Uncharacterized protein n=1 Tax=Arundo donax TaxID=35708 RepID=A0A0A8XU13_ARUDO
MSMSCYWVGSNSATPRDPMVLISLFLSFGLSFILFAILGLESIGVRVRNSEQSSEVPKKKVFPLV